MEEEKELIRPGKYHYTASLPVGSSWSQVEALNPDTSYTEVIFIF